MKRTFITTALAASLIGFTTPTQAQVTAGGQAGVGGTIAEQAANQAGQAVRNQVGQQLRHAAGAVDGNATGNANGGAVVPGAGAINGQATVNGQAINGRAMANGQPVINGQLVPNGQPNSRQVINGQLVQYDANGRPIQMQGQGRPIQQQGQFNQGEYAQGQNVQGQNTQGQQNQQGTSLATALIQKCQKANQAEIELAQMAQQTTGNAQVKEYAQMLQTDHRQLSQDLEKLQQKVAGSQQGSMSVRVPDELTQLVSTACDNQLRMTKDMLGKCEKEHFPMAFLSQQIGAHTAMLAELRAIEQQGPQELRDFASQAATKVQTHLDKAKSLAKQIDDDSHANRDSSKS